MTQTPKDQNEPNPKIPAPGTSETFPAYPEGNEEGGLSGIPVPDQPKEGSDATRIEPEA